MSRPATPTGFSVIMSGTTPVLSWDAQSDCDNFEIRRFVPGDSDFTIRAGPNGRGEDLSGTATSWNDSHYDTFAPSAKKYNGLVIYGIRAINDDGRSGWARASVTVIGGSTFAVTAMPTLTAFAAAIDSGLLLELNLTTGGASIVRTLPIAGAGQVARMGTYLLVGDYSSPGSGTLTVVNRTSWSIVASLSDDRFAYCTGIEVAGAYAWYVSQTAFNGPGGVIVVSLLNPSIPTIVGNTTNPNVATINPFGIARWNDYGFLAENNSQYLTTVDFTDPLNPTYLESVKVWGVGEGPTILNETMLDYPILFGMQDGGEICAYDVSNPRDVRIIGVSTYNLGFDDSFGAKRQRNKIYSVSTTGLVLKTECSDPTAMRVEASLQLPAGAWWDIVLAGKRAYCIGDGKLSTLDISSSTPTLVSTLTDSRLAGGNMILL